MIIILLLIIQMYSLLEKIDTNIRLYVTIDDKKYYVDQSNSFMVFALNTILVLEGVRKSYRISTDCNNEQNLNSYFCKLALNFNNSLSSYSLIPEEPLIFLKDNQHEILNTFKNEANINIAYGKVLGYGYTGKYWCGNSLGNTYAISYVASDGSGNEYILFTFNVPQIKYTMEMKKKILNDKIKYDCVLNQYDMTLNFNTMIHTDDDVIIMDDLP
jgi:hypothetical protein